MSRSTVGLLGLMLALLALFFWNRIETTAPPVPSQGATAQAPALPQVGLDDVTLAAYPGRVADAADRLGGFRDVLDRMTTELMEDLGIDLHIVTVADPHTTIERLADAIFERRQISRVAPTGGMLIVLNAARSEARIEVSYDLEGAFTDAFLGSLAELQLAPYASYRFSGMAVMDVVSILQDTGYLQALRGNLELDPGYRGRQGYLDAASYLSGGGGAQTEIPDLSADLDFKAKVPVKRRARYAPARDPVESAEAYIRVLSDWAGDPTLELFTPGTRIMRRGYPFAPFEAMERAERMKATRPWWVETEGDRAVVFSNRASRVKFALPLHRIDGTWKVDLVEKWKNLFTGKSRNPIVNNANTPYYFAFRKIGTADPLDMAAWDIGDRALEDVVDRLREVTQEDGSPLTHFLLAELLWRNCFLALEAFEHYESAVRLAPDSYLFLETLGDRSAYIGFNEMAVDAYSRMGNTALLKLARAHQQAGNNKEALKAVEREIGRDPLNLAALRRLEPLLREAGRSVEANTLSKRIDTLTSDSKLTTVPITVAFNPPRPVFNTREPTVVGDVVVYDHSQFALTLTNPTKRPVQVHRVKVMSRGTASTSGLGDIKMQMNFPRSDYVLRPGESAVTDRTWGFVIDTKHQQISYVVEFCWTQLDVQNNRCRFARVDTLPE